MLGGVGVGAGQADPPPGEPRRSWSTPSGPLSSQPSSTGVGPGASATRGRDPASGSLNSWHQISRGVEDRAAATAAFCSSVPWASSVGPARLMPTRLTGWGARGPGVLHVEERDLHRRGVAAAVPARPVDADPAVGGQLRLPRPPPGDLLVERRERPAAARGWRPATPAPPAANASSSAVKRRSTSEVPEPVAAGGVRATRCSRVLVVGGERSVGGVAAVPDPRRRRRRPGRRRNFWCARVALHDLVGAGGRRARAATRT